MEAVLGSRYWIEVYGCQMNVSDSENICGILDAAGWSRVEGPEEADAIIVVTCAVREHAEVRALGRITQLGATRGARGRPVTAVCGCVAEEHGKALLDRFPAIDHAVGPDRYRDLPLILAGGRSSSTGHGDHHYEGVVPVRRTFPRSFVTIMRGCDNYCSYCIVPYVRGRERSRPSDAVVEEAASLASAGYGEITLLGQNVNSYRSGATGFPELLERVSKAAGGAWVRFVTSHPRDLTPGLVETMRSCRNVCRALHLPVQSGSDPVLRAMNRGYTRGAYVEKVRMLREAIPGIVLSTDMIAGFPGETDRDFEDSAALLEEVGFDYAFLFRYSERRGTAAAAMDDPVPAVKRLERLHRLQEIQGAVTRRLSADLSGRFMPVLVTGPGGRPGQTLGRTAGNRAVVFEGSPAPAGRFVLAVIESGDGWTHFARFVRDLGVSERFEACEGWAGAGR